MYIENEASDWGQQKGLENCIKCCHMSNEFEFSPSKFQFHPRKILPQG